LTPRFFFLIAVIVVALIPVTERELRGFNYFCIALAGCWSAMYAIESWSDRRARRRQHPPSRAAAEDFDDTW
jgi:hypothetical protein